MPVNRICDYNYRLFLQKDLQYGSIYERKGSDGAVDLVPMKKYELRSGVAIPQIGLGTWKLNDQDALKTILAEVARGECFLVDTAAAYGNEIDLSKALRELSFPREAMFIQDKLWNTNRGYEQTQQACRKSLKKLKLDYLDAYLIHWPASPKLYENWQEINAETWRGMERLKEDGLVRVIGVCNFKPHHMEELRLTAKELPEIDQFELHPGFYPREVLDYCRENDILFEASSPLGNGQILEHPLLVEIGNKYGKTAAQVCMRWALEKGAVPIAKTGSPKRWRENCDIFDFSLSNEERSALDAMEYCGGIGMDADEITEFG